MTELPFPSGATLVVDGGNIVERIPAPEIDPRFASAHYMDGRDLKQEEQKPAVSLGALLREMLKRSSLKVADGKLVTAPAPVVSEPTRLPLAYFHKRTTFDTFGPGYEVYSDAVSSGFVPSEKHAHTHPLQTLGDSTCPAHASANLLKVR